MSQKKFACYFDNSKQCPVRAELGSNVPLIPFLEKACVICPIRLLEWVAADHDLSIINALARTYETPFEVSRRQLHYYRRKYGGEIQRIREQRRTEAISRGLAVKEERVARLQGVAHQYEERLALGLQGVQIKDAVKLTKEYRETLDQIGREMKVPPEGISEAYLAAVDRIIDEVLHVLLTIAGQAVFNRVLDEIQRYRGESGPALPRESQGHRDLLEGAHPAAEDPD